MRKPWIRRDLVVLWALCAAFVGSAGPAAAQAPAGSSAPPKAEAEAREEASGTQKPTKAERTPSGAGGAERASPPASEAARQTELYGDRLDGLQAEVDALKDKIFRSRARLALLQQTVMRGALAGSRVVLAHRNLMGSGYKLVRVVYTLDGAQIYARTDETGSLDVESELVVYDGNLAPGPHELGVELVYKGHGYGIFAYLTGFTFTSKSSHAFSAPENGALKIVSGGYEEGNFTTEMHDRPAVSWQEIPIDATGRPLPEARSSARR